MQERLQKIMAAAGVASRRKSEELISSGLVTVNGQIVSELGAKADLEHDHIRVNGKLLHGEERKVYLVLNKPKGYVSTVSDPEGRPTVMELVKGVGERLFPVGRLDYLSEGLLLLTNDGALMQRLTRASSHVPKTYLVKVSGKPSEEGIQKLRNGIVLPPEIRPGETRARPERAVKTAPAQIMLTRDAENPWYEVVLTEGRNRQIRRMFKQIGHNVEKIKRVRYGALELDVETGKYRQLTLGEVAMLIRPPREKASAKPQKTYGVTALPSGKPQRRSTPSRFAGRDEKRPERSYRRPEGAEERRPARSYGEDRGEQRRGRYSADGRPESYRNAEQGEGRPSREYRSTGHRDDRPARFGRPDRSEGRPPREPRQDRGERRPGRTSAAGGFEQRPGRGYRADRGEGRPVREYRGGGRSGERPARFGRPDRGEGRPPREPRQDRGEQRPGRYSADRSASRGEGRPPREFRGTGRSDERPARFSRPDRGDGRPPRGPRTDRGEQRPGRYSADGRPEQYRNRERGEGRPTREYRGAGRSDERPARFSRPERGEGRPPREPRQDRREQRPGRYSAERSADRGEGRPTREYRGAGRSDDRPARSGRSDRGEGRPPREYGAARSGEKPTRSYKDSRGGGNSFARGPKRPFAGGGKPSGGRGPRRPQR